MNYNGKVHISGIELSFDITDLQLIDELSKSIFGVPSDKLSFGKLPFNQDVTVVGSTEDVSTTGRPTWEFTEAPRNSTKIELAKAIRVLRCGISGGGIER